jgi:hypothetical protein
MAEALKIVTTVGNELEADLVCGLLADVGIHSMQQASARGGQWNPGVPYDVYVAEHDLERAREVLSETDGAAGDAPTAR